MLYAILVGINKYKDPDIRNLTYACADAKALGKLIEESIHPTERQVRLLLDEEATKRNLMVAIGEELPRLATSREDVILLYFAGHGSPETDNSPDEVSRYLVLHETEYGNIYSTGIDMERELPRWFERIINPKLVILFIDACFSGRVGGRTFEGPTFSRIRTKFRGPISLKTLDLGEGRLMISACDDNQVAREDGILGHGIFTYHLIETLKQPSTRDTISVLALYDKVAQAVRSNTNGRQVPIINGRSRFAQLPSFGKTL
jgi:uncharacterized caspase-like protein